ncbi:hypothetical protein CGRA01v4_07760 [Colletotrichum graminicola]|nr:hypothetical protein CGRA01v4_07760 [Colletotrichum graminicola]
MQADRESLLRWQLFQRGAQGSSCTDEESGFSRKNHCA